MSVWFDHDDIRRILQICVILLVLHANKTLVAKCLLDMHQHIVKGRSLLLILFLPSLSTTVTDSQLAKCKTAMRPRSKSDIVLFTFGGGAISLFFFRVIFPPLSFTPPESRTTSAAATTTATRRLRL